MKTAANTAGAVFIGDQKVGEIKGVTAPGQVVPSESQPKMTEERAALIRGLWAECRGRAVPYLRQRGFYRVNHLTTPMYVFTLKPPAVAPVYEVITFTLRIEPHLATLRTVRFVECEGLQLEGPLP